MATQNAISSKEVTIWLDTKYSFKIEKNSSLIEPSLSVVWSFQKLATSYLITNIQENVSST